MNDLNLPEISLSWHAIMMTTREENLLMTVYDHFQNPPAHDWNTGSINKEPCFSKRILIEYVQCGKNIQGDDIIILELIICGSMS